MKRLALAAIIFGVLALGSTAPAQARWYRPFFYRPAVVYRPFIGPPLPPPIVRPYYPRSYYYAPYYPVPRPALVAPYPYAYGPSFRAGVYVW